MKWVVAVLTVAFALSVAGTAVAAPLDDAPGSVAAASEQGQDSRSPDAAVPFVVPDSASLPGSSDDGLSAAWIVLLAAGGVLAAGGAAYTLRRVMVSHRHAVG